MNTILGYHRPTNTAVSLPVVSTDCYVCGQFAAPSSHDVHACRVDGDSKYGYEMGHDVCIKVLDALLDVNNQFSSVDPAVAAGVAARYAAIMIRDADPDLHDLKGL